MILDDKEKRHKYMVEHLRMTIAFQVRLLRLQREWTLEELAEKCGIKIENITKLENWDAEFPTIETLRKVAQAFDCALLVGFEGWESLIKMIVPTYDQERGNTQETESA